MSAAMTMTPPASPPPTSTMITTSHHPAMSTYCPSCGSSIPDANHALLEAQKQISDLQAQVRLLNQKAAAAVDRWADYEDELAKLRATLNMERANNSIMSPPPPSKSPSPGPGADTITPAPSLPASSPRASNSFLPAGAANRISQLLSRKSTPNLSAQAQSQTGGAVPPPLLPQSQRLSQQGQTLLASLPVPLDLPSPTPSADDLVEALSKEQRRRLAAEGKLDDTSREVEELSVQLFEQANEMVATERKARAHLEQRVSTLERRDQEKRGRLEMLEGAVGRIGRVRSLIGDQ